jgi:hypothetical protein
VDAGEVEAERFRAFHQSPQVGVPAQQVVDQFPTQAFLAADQITAGDGVAFGERRDGVIDNVEDRSCRCAYRLAITGAHHHRQLLP